MQLDEVKVKNFLVLKKYFFSSESNWIDFILV